MFGPGSGFTSFVVSFNFALIGLGIYSMVLFIRLAHRGIKALDIYIDRNKKDNQ
ncbi:hypothetical protein [Stenotrophomonas maltophilia group sp. RNC7]|uniref:hypothetical protein n=1 Tax=Stenotrophomonas maltophilia group sp. RNC7 TaxID=3071467 RepID=UPI0027DFE932|nr:hypothetical protein [Stenotrophomonas maltophilia group sp. RNC7]MDQ4678120.1 hypothetical protein [Stenotrophomonas maltophilia group sp. RNC7]